VAERKSSRSSISLTDFAGFFRRKSVWFPKPSSKLIHLETAGEVARVKGPSAQHIQLVPQDVDLSFQLRLRLEGRDQEMDDKLRNAIIAAQPT
jgi:hypothetical protein